MSAGGKLLWTGRKKERSSQQGDAEQAMDADDQPYEWRKQEYDQACRAPCDQAQGLTWDSSGWQVIYGSRLVLTMRMGAPGEEGARGVISGCRQAEPGPAAGEEGEHLLPGKRQLL